MAEILSSTLTCPHCGAPNQSTSAFCESCGKALPAAAPSAPRIVTDAAMPATGAGRQLVGEELQRHLKKAKGALLTVAVIQSVFALIIFGALKAAGQNIAPVLVITLLGIAIVFFGLYAWSRRSPLPAAIAGLTVYVTLHVVDAIVDPTQLGRGLIMKIIIVAILVQAIQAGIKYKRLLPDLQPVH